MGTIVRLQFHGDVHHVPSNARMLTKPELFVQLHSNHRAEQRGPQTKLWFTSLHKCPSTVPWAHLVHVFLQLLSRDNLISKPYWPASATKPGFVSTVIWKTIQIQNLWWMGELSWPLVHDGKQCIWKWKLLLSWNISRLGPKSLIVRQPSVNCQLVFTTGLLMHP